MYACTPQRSYLCMVDGRVVPTAQPRGFLLKWMHYHLHGIV